MNSTCFITQIATEEILLRVTNVCAECYNDISEGDTVHYDTQTCRYLCNFCEELLCSKTSENSNEQKSSLLH